VAQRGTDCYIVSGLNQPWGDVEACTSCGKCVNACPTGAIFQKADTTSEKERDREMLEFLVNAREKREWTR
jgi:bidirectional [NiFe] hydrogenase diaphorase subunit